MQNEELKEELEEIEAETSNTEEVEKPEMGDNPEDYKIIIDMIKEMDEHYNTLKEFTSSMLEEIPADASILEGILPIKEEDIPTMSYDEIDSFLESYMKAEDFEKECENAIEFQDDVDTMEQAARKFLGRIKEMSMNLYQAKHTRDKLKDESRDVLNEYIQYMSSTRVQKAREDQLTLLKDQLKTDPDTIEKKKIMKKIDAMESAKSLSFLFTRFETLGESEVKSVKEAFFDTKRGSYIIDRYKEKIGKFGFNPNLYKYFFNIEENFLEKEYHPFNNVFLFFYMRFVAYSDPYDQTEGMYVRAITTAISNLIYHRFINTPDEMVFIEIVKRVDSRFESYRDYFTEKNETQPSHPNRISADKKRETDRKNMLIKKMDELKITGYDSNATADEMQEYMNDELDKLIESQIKETDTDNVIVNEDEDGVVSVEPTMGRVQSESDDNNSDDSESTTTSI